MNSINNLIIHPEIFFNKVIIVCGPRCTGKTIISKNIQSELQNHINQNNVVVSPSSFKLNMLCLKQLFRKKFCGTLTTKLIILDENLSKNINKINCFKKILTNSELYKITTIIIAQDYNDIDKELAEISDVKICTTYTSYTNVKNNNIDACRTEDDINYLFSDERSFHMKISDQPFRTFKF